MASRILPLLALLLPVLSAFALSSPPSGAITVGSGGKYATLSAALLDTSSSVYFLYPGTYEEQVYTARTNLKIYGQTTTAGSYTGNTVLITNALSSAQAGSNDLSGTVRIAGTGISLYNLNITNAYGAGAQAIALSIQASNFAAYGVALKGYQDTLLANKGYEFISHSYIEGVTDFIFGTSASLWIESSTIHALESGWVTASGRSSDDANWYVINNSDVSGGAATQTTYLGRPWRDYARVVFQNTCLHANVKTAGWSAWSTDTPNTDHVTFAEYNNRCTGAAGPRASFATALSAAVTRTAVLGSDAPSWIDSAFL